MTLIFRSITWILASLTLFLQKSLKIPVRNQKCHSELLRGRFQDTEKKEQFLTKNWHFCTKNEFFFGTLRYFYLNVPKILSLRMYDSVSVLVEIDGQKRLKMKYQNFNCKRGHLTPINMAKSSKYVLIQNSFHILKNSYFQRFCT